MSRRNRTSSPRLFEGLDRHFPGGGVLLGFSADHGFLVIPEAEKNRNKAFRGGRLVGESHAMVGTMERLNRALSEDLCLPAGNKPLYRAEGFSVKYDRTALLKTRTLPGSCGPEGLVPTTKDVDRALSGTIARLYLEEIEKVLLVSGKENWDRKDPATEFALNDLDPERSGDAFLIPRPGVLMHWDPGRGSGHGSHYANDTNVPLVFWGAGVTAGMFDEPVTPYDLAPTLGRALGVTLPDTTGRALVLSR